MNLGLIPIRNFGIVLPGIYRSAQPLYTADYKWLAKLGVKKIINLRKESKHDKVAKKVGIEVVNIPVADHCAPTMAQVKKFQKHIGDGVLFHCEHGHGRTSSFSVITNLIHGKSLGESLHIELFRFGYHFKHKKQLQFLKNLKLK